MTYETFVLSFFLRKRLWRMPVTIKSCCRHIFPLKIMDSVLNGINCVRRGRLKKIFFVMKVLLSLSKPSDYQDGFTTTLHHLTIVKRSKTSILQTI